MPVTAAAPEGRFIWCNVFIAPAGWQYCGVLKVSREAADRSTRDPVLGRRIGVWRIKLKGEQR